MATATDPPMPQGTRSVLAVLAGWALGFCVGWLSSRLMIALIVQRGIPISQMMGLQTVNIGINFLAAVFCGWLTARLANRLPVQHGVALAGLHLLVAACFLAPHLHQLQMLQFGVLALGLLANVGGAALDLLRPRPAPVFVPGATPTEYVPLPPGPPPTT